MAKSGGYNVGVLGATGMVGRLLLDILEERAFPLKDLRLFASANSKGKLVDFAGQGYPVEETTADSFDGLDILFASAATGANRHFSPIAARAGVAVVDDSSAFRMDPDVPLVIAGVNDDDSTSAQWHHRGPELLHDTTSAGNQPHSSDQSHLAYGGGYLPGRFRLGP